MDDGLKIHFLPIPNQLCGYSYHLWSSSMFIYICCSPLDPPSAAAIEVFRDWRHPVCTDTDDTCLLGGSCVQLIRCLFRCRLTMLFVIFFIILVYFFFSLNGGSSHTGKPYGGSDNYRGAGRDFGGQGSEETMGGSTIENGSNGPRGLSRGGYAG